MSTRGSIKELATQAVRSLDVQKKTIKRLEDLVMPREEYEKMIKDMYGEKLEELQQQIDELKEAFETFLEQ